MDPIQGSNSKNSHICEINSPLPVDELAAAAPGVSGDVESAEGGQLGGQVPHGVGRQAVVVQAQGTQGVQGAVQFRVAR